MLPAVQVSKGIPKRAVQATFIYEQL